MLRSFCSKSKNLINSKKSFSNFTQKHSSSFLTSSKSSFCNTRNYSTTKFKLNSTINNSNIVTKKNIREQIIDWANIIKEPMTRTRPFFIFNYTLSNLAGHCSFILLACSYLETDFFLLRTYALGALTCSIIFQFYREKSLWIPIRWNFVFLLINFIMVMNILKSEKEANNMSEDQRLIYDEFFSSKGMTLIEFNELMNKARKLESRAGDTLVSTKKTNTRLYFVIKGDLSVSKNQIRVGTIHKYQFAGSRSFRSWIEKRYLEKEKTEKENNSLFENIPTNTSTLNKILSNEALIENANVNSLWSNVTSYFYPTKSSESDLVETASKEVEEVVSENEGAFGLADVKCETETVVTYYWKFKDLEKLREDHHFASVLESCLGSDLNSKMDLVWEGEVKEKYKQLLTGAVIDGEVNEVTRKNLKNYRDLHSISELDHMIMLEELDWTMDDYVMGFHGAHSVSKYRDYTQMLSNYIVNNKNISEAEKRELRQYRKKYNISSETHVHILKSLGWTIDDYEVGRKLEDSSTSDDTSSEDLIQNKDDQTPAPYIRGTRRRKIRQAISNFFYSLSSASLYDYESTSKDNNSTINDQSLPQNASSAVVATSSSNYDPSVSRIIASSVNSDPSVLRRILEKNT